MREIKFRFWNEVTETMHYPEDWKETASRMECSEMIPMQFTGLKDKNGKEIYEGDIVRIRYKKMICEVRFTFGSFWIYGKNGFGNHLRKYDYTCEVIGNKLENPELLK